MTNELIEKADLKDINANIKNFVQEITSKS